MEETLRKWDVDLSDSEINDIKANKFKEMWSSMANAEGNLPIESSV
jgi:hypothetical protein